jgi:hypothetical protein
MINPFPHELAINGVYLSPLLVVVILAFLATLLSTVILNKLRITQFLIHLPLNFLAIMTLYIILIDTLFIKI